MKLFNSITLCTLALMSASMQSCLGDDDNGSNETLEFVKFENLTFNAADYWTGCYDVAAGNIVTPTGFSFSHTASAFEYGGVTYTSWNGFCPSKVNDTEDYEGDWNDHQWACIAPNPNNFTYLVANSEAQVSQTAADNDKCSVSMLYGEYFKPKYVWVTNSSYTYYSAKNGSAFNTPFSVDDNFILHIVGLRNGAETGHLQFALINHGQYLDQWAGLSIEALGTVDKVLFYASSTMANDYGMTIPAYFCIADFYYTPVSFDL